MQLELRAGVGGGVPGSVYQCSFNSDGSIFTACNATGAPSWVPYDVTFESIAGTLYAYVADNGTGSLGNVYQCSLNLDGSFNACTGTPTITPTPTVDWVPSDIAFATLHGTQYAYVAASQGSMAGNMFICTLDGAGLFSACNPTPIPKPTPWLPMGIAFRPSL